MYSLFLDMIEFYLKADVLFCFVFVGFCQQNFWFQLFMSTIFSFSYFTYKSARTWKCVSRRVWIRDVQGRQRNICHNNLRAGHGRKKKCYKCSHWIFLVHNSSLRIIVWYYFYHVWQSWKYNIFISPYYLNVKNSVCCKNEI